MEGSISSILAVGGPFSVVTAILVILVKAFFDSRKDKREDKAAEVQNESGVVDNARKVVELIQGETDRMEKRIEAYELRARSAELRAQNLEMKVNDQEDQLARQARELEFVREDLAKAHKEIQQLRDAQ